MAKQISKRMSAFALEAYWDFICVGDRITGVTPHGNLISGKVVIKNEDSFVINAGGPYGTPYVITSRNIYSVSSKVVDRAGAAGAVIRSKYNN